MTDQLASWQGGPPASPDELSVLRSAFPDLPAEYLGFLARNNGGEGDLGLPTGWLQLWAAEQVPELNVAYEVREFLSGFIAIGSDGGGELFAFDARREQPWPVCAVPVVGMSPEEARMVASAFSDFTAAVGRPLPA